MPSGDHCCVPRCSNRRSKNPNLSFHSFPRKEDLRKKWIVAIRRDVGEQFQITGNTVVCSEHFLDSSFHPVHPMSDPSSPGKTKKRSRVLMTDAVPCRFAFGPPASRERPSLADRFAIGASRALDLQEKKELAAAAAAAATAAAETENERKLRTQLEETRRKLSESEKKVEELGRRVDSLEQENAKLRSQVFSFENIRGDNEKLSHLTGLSTSQWEAVWGTLDVQSKADLLSPGSAMTEEKGRRNAPGAGVDSPLSLEDQFLLTLMRLRLGWLQLELAYVFGVSEATVSRVFRKWIAFLYLRLGALPIWPSWEDVHASMPECFRTSYPDTFIIVDATELRTEVPSSLALRSKLYSAYKSHTTVKGLVGIAPSGSFTFVSELYTGSISDRELVIRSGILLLLDSVPSSKQVMADRGFDIQDLLVKPNLLLNIPAFKGSRAFLPLSEVVQTQKIASVRIHVERAIGRVKRKFHILQKDIPLPLFASINEIWCVCRLLTNFFGPLIANPDE